MRITVKELIKNITAEDILEGLALAAILAALVPIFLILLWALV